MNVAFFCAVVQIKSYLWYLKMYFCRRKQGEKRGESKNKYLMISICVLNLQVG